MTIFQWTTVQANYVYKVVAEQEKNALKNMNNVPAN